MAEVTVVQITDDITGEVIPESEAQTVAFGLDGKTYEIDLSADRAKELREVLALYVSHARAAKPAPRTRVTASRKAHDGPDLAEVRAWARAQGMKCSDKGRVPLNVLEAWHQRGDDQDEPETASEPAVAPADVEVTDEMVLAWWTGVKKHKMPANGRVMAPWREQYRREVLGQS